MPTAAYIRPDEFATAGAVVTGTASDSTYVLGWLCDGRANRPARATVGTVSWTATFASAEVGAVVVACHNIDAGLTIGLGGAGSTTSPSARQNQTPYNAVKVLTTPSAMTTLGLSVTSNSHPVIVGELIGGKLRYFPRCGPMLAGLSGEYLDNSNGVEALSVPSYDNGESGRAWSFAVAGTRTELDDMFAWYESQRNASKFSVFIPDITINDAPLVKLQPPRWTLIVQGIYRIEINLKEVTRVRWGVGL